jgi:hypothetical protein
MIYARACRMALVNGSKNLSAGASNAQGSVPAALESIVGHSPSAILSAAAVNAGITAIELGYASIDAHKIVDTNWTLAFFDVFALAA